MQRRLFLGKIAAVSAASVAASSCPSSAVGANNRIRLGWIGCGGRGRYVAERMRKVPEVEFVAVCDVYETNRLRAKQRIGGNCTAHNDFRELLDRKDIDAVLIATPDHWHAIPTVFACQAGKDVYVEKPLAHNVREGRAMVTAARAGARIVQTGTQQRSAAHFDTIRDIIRAGKLGNVRFIRIWNYRNNTPSQAASTAVEKVPKGLDWELFLGPAPLHPYVPDRFFNFRNYQDYAGGISTDFGTHRFDSVRHAMSAENLAPRTVSGVSHRFEVQDGSEDADVIQMTFDYDDFVISYEACRMNALGMGYRTPGRPYYRMMGVHDRPNGMAFYGTEGTLFADRLGFELYPELKPGKRADRLRPEQVTPDLFRTAATDGRSDDSTLQHTQNFIDCVRSRALPVADVSIGHGSTLLPHLGNIACRTGQKLQWDAKNEEITNSQQASRLLTRAARKPWDVL